MNFENANQKSLEDWSVAEWKTAIQEIDVENKLSPFNDVLTDTQEPSSKTKEHFVLQDVTIGGKICDIYHWDQDENGERIPNSTLHRVFVHIKN